MSYLFEAKSSQDFFVGHKFALHGNGDILIAEGAVGLRFSLFILGVVFDEEGFLKNVCFVVSTLNVVDHFFGDYNNTSLRSPALALTNRQGRNVSIIT